MLPWRVYDFDTNFGVDAVDKPPRNLRFWGRIRNVGIHSPDQPIKIGILNMIVVSDHHASHTYMRELLRNVRSTAAHTGNPDRQFVQDLL
jgi:hypothetical protein